MYYISLERSFSSVSTGLCCIKIHAEMAEKSQVKARGLIFTSAPVYIYDCCTYFQSINKIVQSFFSVTFETSQRTFFAPQNCVYTQKQFYF